jgi:DNA polymerase III alpha subunit
MKLNLKNRSIDQDGKVILNDQGIIDSIFAGNTAIDKINAEQSEEVETYNKWANMFDDLPSIKAQPEIVHKANQEYWNMPEFFRDLDIEEFLLSLCSTDEEKFRVKYELALYQERDLYSLLKYIVYLVDSMRNNNIVWGVGRGSSVSSYILYKIGLHKVDSMFYDLDVKEFLK